LLWTGVGTALVGAGLAVWQAVYGSTQASEYNNAATFVRTAVTSFLDNIRSKDGTAGTPLTREILIERLCALRRDCRQDQFGVSPLGREFPDPPYKKEDEDAKSKLDSICTAP
jgi:hypothetical protein